MDIHNFSNLQRWLRLWKASRAVATCRDRLWRHRWKRRNKFSSISNSNQRPRRPKRFRARGAFSSHRRSSRHASRSTALRTSTMPCSRLAIILFRCWTKQISANDTSWNFLVRWKSSRWSYLKWNSSSILWSTAPNSNPLILIPFVITQMIWVSIFPFSHSYLLYPISNWFITIFISFVLLVCMFVLQYFNAF